MPSGVYIRKIGLKRKPLSIEHKKKISNFQIGNKNTFGKRWNMSEDGINKIKKHHSHYWLGKKRPDISGEKSHCWKGGISNYLYPDDWTNILKNNIRERDGFICQECGIHQDELDGRVKRLDVHHIDYDKNNCNENNLITLCRVCHIKTNNNRNYWIKYFKE